MIKSLLVRYDASATPTRKEILAKALSAMRAGRITGHEATRCEASLNANRLPDQATLQKIYDPAEFSKAFGGSDRQPVRGIRRAAPFDDLVANMAAWQRSQRRR